MVSETTHTTPTPDSILRKLAELEERQSWAHHVADAATGELLTTPLSQPVTPLSRLERLSRLGHQFDPSIFGAPTHRLTPRHPYQASPRGALSYFLPTEVFPEDFIETFEGSALWDLRPDFIVEGPAGAHFGMLASLSEPPQGRCLLTLRLAAVNTFQQVGRILIVLRQRHGDPSPPPLASFELAVHGEHFVAHTFDLVFVPEPTLPLQVGMGFRPGSGLDLVLFRWLTLAPAPPLDVHP